MRSPKRSAAAGRRLDRMNVLPTPFPIEDLLDPRELTHLRRLFGLGGLSYGNLSVRRDAKRFWMSASGVNKAEMKTVGRDMLLVKGYDAARNVIMLSVPEDVEPRRVSVDAIEHWMIYTQNPASAPSSTCTPGWMAWHRRRFSIRAGRCSWLSRSRA